MAASVGFEGIGFVMRSADRSRLPRMRRTNVVYEGLVMPICTWYSDPRIGFSVVERAGYAFIGPKDRKASTMASED